MSEFNEKDLTGGTHPEPEERKTSSTPTPAPPKSSSLFEEGTAASSSETSRSSQPSLSADLFAASAPQTPASSASNTYTPSASTAPTSSSSTYSSPAQAAPSSGASSPAATSSAPVSSGTASGTHSTSATPNTGPASSGSSPYSGSYTAPPSQQPPPSSSGQYWSSLDARKAQQSQTGQNSGNTGAGYSGPSYNRPPYQHPTPPLSQPGYQPYEPYRQQQNPYQAPYQHNANGSWQNNNGGQQYEWNFQEYDKLAGTGPNKKKKRNKGLIAAAVAVLGLLSIALVGLSAVSIYNAVNQPDTVDAPPAAVQGQENSEVETAGAGEDAAQMELASKPVVEESYSADGKLTIPQVASKLLPSVVSVETYQQLYSYEPYGLGSGIIMNEEGYVITNHHVIAGADAYKVTLNNGDPYEARLIGSDERTDLAVLKIEAEDLVAAEFGNSEELMVGETVIAIGNPASMELVGSVTQGIVSAVNRQVSTGTYSMTYIQTDAAINPGNSGGALANEYGQVVGINTAKIAENGFEGIGFAIPINEAKPVIDDIIANGRVTGRVMLGITAQAVDEVDARRYDVPMGLRIVTIDPSSDMGRKGVQTMDIITHIEGERIYNYDDLRAQLENFQVGDTVRLTLYRQTSVLAGQSYDVSITLIEDMG